SGTRMAITSRLLHPGKAIAVGADGSLDNLAAARRNELQAVTALLVSVGLVLVLHRFLADLLLRQCTLARQHACRHDGACQQGGSLQHHAARHLRLMIHGSSSSKIVVSPSNRTTGRQQMFR